MGKKKVRKGKPKKPKAQRRKGKQQPTVVANKGK